MTAANITASKGKKKTDAAQVNNAKETETPHRDS